MMKMLRVSTAVSAVLVLSSLTSLTAADDDFSWGNLFGWRGAANGDDSSEGAGGWGRSRARYTPYNYGSYYRVNNNNNGGAYRFTGHNYQGAKAGYKGYGNYHYRVNPWYNGYNTYRLPQFAGGDSSREHGGGGGWQVPLALPGSHWGQGRGQAGGDSSGEGGWGRPRWGTNVNVVGGVGVGGGVGGGGSSSGEDGGRGPVMHSVFGGVAAGGDSSREDGGRGPVMHGVFGGIAAGGDSSREDGGRGPVMHGVFGGIAAGGDSSREDGGGGPVMHGVFGGVAAGGDSSRENSREGPVMHGIWNTGAGDSSEELGGGPVLHDVWDDDDGLEFSDDNDIFQLHFGGGGGVRPPTPQPPTQAPTTTTSTTTAAPTTPLPTPYPGAKCQQAADVAVLVDISDSMGLGDLQKVQLSLDDLVDDLKVSPNGRHMTLLAYSSQLLLETALSGNPALLKSRIGQLKPQAGRPNTALAMQEMIKLMGRQGRPGVPKSCIVVMDENSADRAAAVRQAAMARRLGIQMLVVGVGLDGSLDFDELKDLADDNYHLLFAENFGDLPGVMKFATTTLCPAVGTTAGPTAATSARPHRTTSSPHSQTTPAPATTRLPVVTTPRVTSHPVTTPRPTRPPVTTPRPTRLPVTTPRPTRPPVTTPRPTRPPVTTPRPTRPPVTTPRVTPRPVTTSRPTQPPVTTPRVTPPRVTTPRVTPPRVTTPRVSTPRVTTPRVTTARPMTPSPATTPSAVTTPRPTVPAICDNCVMVNGVGYKAHWASCDLFIQCQFLPDGSVTVRIKQCPHGLHWDQKALTCTRPSQAKCPFDKCRQPGYRLYAATNNCRGYWVCVSGVSEGKCCPSGYAFKAGSGCVPSPGCNDPCGVSPTVPDKCDKRAVTQMPLMYEQYVPGLGWKLMYCAPGTAYNHSQCSCSTFKPGPIPSTCRPELYLPFNGDVKDESGNNNYVQNEGVKVVNGVGHFDGNAVLRVPRFANANYGDFVLIRLRYKQDPSGGGQQGNQALVANGDCLKPSSLYMVANQQGITFGAQTTTGKNATVNVPSTTGGWKEAVMYVDRHTLTGSVNNYSMQTLFTGSLATSKCALQIGRGTNFDHFKGLMDDITVYLCRPKTF